MHAPHLHKFLGVILGAVCAAAVVALALAFALSASRKRNASAATPFQTMDQFLGTQKHRTGRRQGGIPKILWRTGPFPSSGSMPTGVQDALRSAAHAGPSDMVQVYVDDSDAHQYVRTKWPQFVDVYDSLVPGAFKADLWRLLVLYEYGGVYADLGFVFHKPLAPALVSWTRDDLVLVMDPPHAGQEALYQAFMAAVPEHPLLAAMIDLVVDNIVTENYGVDTLDITGPVAVARAYRQFFGHAAGPLGVGRRVLTDAQGRVHRVAIGQLVVDGASVAKCCPPGTSSSCGSHVVTGPSGVAVLCTKFPDYHSVMYQQRSVVKYSDLYRQRAVFQTPALFVTFAQFESAWAAPRQTRTTVIPRILWRTGRFSAEHLPKPILDVMASFTRLAPDWVQVYCSDEDQERFLGTRFPDALSLWRSLKAGAFRADVWRLLILYHYGGLYIDLPQQLLVPLAAFLDPSTDHFLGALDRPGPRGMPRLYQAVLAAYPAHPLMHAMATHVLANVRRRAYGEDPLDVTGPTAVARAAMGALGRPLPGPGRHETPMRMTLLHHVGNERVLGPDGRMDVLRTKFPGANDLLYPPGSATAVKYDRLWDTRTLFHEN